MATNIATNIIAFILVLGFLVFAHEAGHFFFAKLFKVRVHVFSFGFGKRLFGFKRGDTDYRVSLIPLGGYVRMAGDMAEEEREGAPDEFLSRPRWQRFLILVAGPAVNLLIALLFLAGFNMVGTEVLKENRPILGSIVPDKPAARAGLLSGDTIVRINGEQVGTWDDLKLLVSMNAGVPLKIAYTRSGAAAETTLVPERVETKYGVTGLAGITKFLGTEIGRVLPGSAAEKAGLRAGDNIIAAAGKPVRHMGELESLMTPGKTAPIPLTVNRGGVPVSITLAAPPATVAAAAGYPGIVPPTFLRKYGPVEALQQSYKDNMKMVKLTFVTLGRLFTPRGSMKELSGPISIARISGEMLRSGWREVILLMASISLQLGIMNLLPIPVLDGGHIAILMVEGAARRELSLRVKERIMQAGFVALAMLMIVVLYNDVISNVKLMIKG